MVCPAAATSLRISGCHIACSPIGKKVALTQWSASALSTAGVLPGHGPSSKVKTTSWSRRKSCILKCSQPKPGPPVVSISTVRDTPKALGFPGQVVARSAAGDEAASTGAAACPDVAIGPLEGGAAGEVG